MRAYGLKGRRNKTVRGSTAWAAHRLTPLRRARAYRQHEPAEPTAAFLTEVSSTNQVGVQHTTRRVRTV